jgi:hypothetical protein
VFAPVRCLRDGEWRTGSVCTGTSDATVRLGGTCQKYRCSSAFRAHLGEIACVITEASPGKAVGWSQTAVDPGFLRSAAVVEFRIDPVPAR